MVNTAKSSFVQAMDRMAVSDKTAGENGSAEYTAEGVEESRVALFFALVRNIPKERLKDLMTLVREQSNEDNPSVMADLFLLTFQTRNCRGGKGEKDLFYNMIMELAKFYPQTVSSLMELVPHYGSYKDWFKLVSLATKDSTDVAVRRSMVPVVQTIMDLAAKQLLKDKSILDDEESWKMLDANESSSSTTTTTFNKSKISLLGKWAPRENKQFKKQARTLALKVFPNSQTPNKEYRKLLSRLNTELSTVEVAMSADQYDTIDPNSIPSICMMKCRKAFLNELVKTPPITGDEDETGNRYPTNASRVQCRKRLRQAMLETNGKKLKGRQLFPHEIVEKILTKSRILSTLEKDLFQCQWEDIRQNTLKAMKDMEEEMMKKTKTTDVDKANQKGKEDMKHANGAVNLRKIVPLVDVSGSMSGVPMQVAIALGILVSEITSPEFANRCLTFHSNPTWVTLDSGMSLFDKVKKIQNSPWGMNTDFEKATEEILRVATKAKLTPEEIPDLIVFSDMQFDLARNARSGHNWETHQDRITRRFKEKGVEVCGKEWPAPHIIYWNLRGDTMGFPAQGDTPNVTMLSGYSPTLMKLLLDGDSVEEEEDLVIIDENGDEQMVETKQKNPYSTLRKALDSEEYDKVRMVLTKSNEGLLRSYHPTEEKMK